jgi:hypothetical protein
VGSSGVRRWGVGVVSSLDLGAVDDSGAMVGGSSNGPVHIQGKDGCGGWKERDEKWGFSLPIGV